MALPQMMLQILPWMVMGCVAGVTMDVTVGGAATDGTAECTMAGMALKTASRLALWMVIWIVVLVILLKSFWSARCIELQMALRTVDGIMNGRADGAIDGAADGTRCGTVDGVVDGTGVSAADGTANGTPDVRDEILRRTVT